METEASKKDRIKEQGRIRIQRFRAKQKRLYEVPRKEKIMGADMNGNIRSIDSDVLRTHGDIDILNERRMFDNQILGTVIEGESYIKKWKDQNGGSSKIPQEIIDKEIRAIRMELNKIRRH